MFLFLDIETTGLPNRVKFGVYYPCTELRHYDSSRVVQVGLMLCDESMEEIDRKLMVVRRDGFVIPNPEFHRITNEISDDRGIPMGEVAEVLVTMMTHASHLLVHNALFDVNVLKSEFHRIGLTEVVEALSNMNIICTMDATTPIMKLPSKFRRGELKPPSLCELYKYATHKAIQNEHDAMGDVESLHEAVSRLLHSGKLTLPSWVPKKTVVEAEESSVTQAPLVQQETEPRPIKNAEGDNPEFHKALNEHEPSYEKRLIFENLEKCTVPELRTLCKSFKIRNYSTLKKNELLEKITLHHRTTSKV